MLLAESTNYSYGLHSIRSEADSKYFFRLANFLNVEIHRCSHCKECKSEWLSGLRNVQW